MLQAPQKQGGGLGILGTLASAFIPGAAPWVAAVNAAMSPTPANIIGAVTGFGDYNNAVQQATPMSSMGAGAGAVAGLPLASGGSMPFGIYPSPVPDSLPLAVHGANVGGYSGTQSTNPFADGLMEYLTGMTPVGGEVPPTYSNSSKAYQRVYDKTRSGALKNNTDTAKQNPELYYNSAIATNPKLDGDAGYGQMVGDISRNLDAQAHASASKRTPTNQEVANLQQFNSNMVAQQNRDKALGEALYHVIKAIGAGIQTNTKGKAKR
jgi:hypothetical protein